MVIGTANGQLHTSRADFSVRARQGDTRVTLLDGGLTAMARLGELRRTMDRRGSRVHISTIRELGGSITDSLVYERRGDPDAAIAWTKATRRYRNASLREFVADMGRWYGIRVKDIHCIPPSMRVTAALCYRAPLEEALAVVGRAGLRVHRVDGVYSFCDSDDGFNPAVAQVNHNRETCSHCGRAH